MVFYSLRKNKRDAHHHWASQLIFLLNSAHGKKKGWSQATPPFVSSLFLTMFFPFYIFQPSFLLLTLCFSFALPFFLLFTFSPWFFLSSSSLLFLFFLFLSMTKLTIAKYSSLDEMFPIISRAFEHLVPSSWCCLGGLGVWSCWRK